METLNSIELNKEYGKPTPLYRQIVHHIRKNIESGSIQAGQRLPTVSKMVKFWGVEYGTVKRAIKHLEKSGFVKYEGRGTGPLVIKDAPPQKTCTIVFPRRCANSHFSELTGGIQAFFMSTKNVDFIVTDSLSNEAHELNFITHPPEGTDGMILYPEDTQEYRKAVKSALKSGIKIVFIDRILSGIDVGSVCPDHFDGTYQVTTHLLENLQLPVYYFGDIDSTTSACQQRYRGWLEAMHDHNYLDTDTYVCKTPTTEPLAYLMHKKGDYTWRTAIENKIYNFFEGNFKDTVILSMNDDAARIVYFVAQKAGFVPGRDVFFAGFGDKPFCQMLPSPLTSVSQDNRKVGYEAAKMLYHSIANNQNVTTNRIIPVHLKIRASSQKNSAR